MSKITIYWVATNIYEPDQYAVDDMFLTDETASPFMCGTFGYFAKNNIVEM